MQPLNFAAKRGRFAAYYNKEKDYAINYLAFILEQLSELNEVSCRPMMGEFLIYLRGKLVAGIYDDRLLVKPLKCVKKLMPEACAEIPYEGAKPMLLVDNVDDKKFLVQLFEEIYTELPAPKPKKK